MPKVTREDQADLQATVHVDITREDYLPQFEKKLKEYRNKVHMPGFRKGKAPLSLLKKMYGRSLLAEVVNELLAQQLSEYLEKKEVELLGEPLASQAQQKITFDPNDLKDFRFSFDIGMAPEFEVQGLTKEKTFTRYMPEITDEMVRKELEQLRQAHAQLQEVEGPFENGDQLIFLLTENTEKETPYEAKFELLWEEIAPAYREKLATLKPGQTIQVDDIYQFPDDWSTEEVDSRILQWNAEAAPEEKPQKPGPAFTLKLENAHRRIVPSLDQEFFDKAFGKDQVHSEEEALEHLRKSLYNRYESKSDTQLYRDIHAYLLEVHDEKTLPLPDEFLKRWLKESNDENTDERIEQGYAEFARSQRWALIKAKLAKKYGIEVTQEDIVRHIYNRLQQGLQAYGLAIPQFINQMLERLLQNKEEVERAFNEVLESRLFEPLKGEFTIEEQVVPLETFEQLIAPPDQEEAVAEAGAKEAARVAAALEEE